MKMNERKNINNKLKIISLFVFIFFIQFIYNTQIIHANPAVIAATIATSTNTYDYQRENLIEFNCVIDNLPAMKCEKSEWYKDCVYYCHKDDGIQTYTIDYNTGNYTSKFISNKQQEVEDKMDDVMTFFYVMIFITIIALILYGLSQLFFY